MAKARPQVYQSPTPLTGAKLEEVRRRLRGGFTGFRDPFPQEIKFKANYKSKWLPPISRVSGLSVADRLNVECEFDPARLTPEVLSGMFRVVSSCPEVGDRSPGLYVQCPIELPQREEHLRRWGEGSISVSIGQGHYRLDLYAGGIMHSRPDGVEFRSKAEEEKHVANERRFIAEIFQKAIDAGRLPLKIDLTGRIPHLRHTRGGPLEYKFVGDDYHLGSFECGLDCSPDELARRFFDVLDAIPSTIPRSFSGGTGVSREKRKADPTPTAYAVIQSHPWPVTSCELKTSLCLAGPEALDGLGPILPTPTASVRVELGLVRPEGQRAGNPSAKLMIKGRRNGHLLSLSVPPELASMKGRIESVTGLTFP
jgi:hypothetical protein